MATLVESSTGTLNTTTTTTTSLLNEVNGNILLRDGGVRRSRSGAQVIRPKLRNANSSSNSSSASSSRSMIGSFRHNSEDANICESCCNSNTTKTCPFRDDSILPLVETGAGVTDESTEGTDDIASIMSIPSTTTFHSNNNNHHNNNPRLDTDEDSVTLQPVWTRTTFAVQNVCCASEVPAIRRILRPYKCRSVGIAVTTKRVTLTYNNTMTNTEEICTALTNGGFPARMVATEVIRESMNDGSCSSNDTFLSLSPTNSIRRKIKASSYVESTISMSSNTGGDRIQDDASLQQMMKQNFSPLSVRACQISVSNNHVSYIKIEHNPNRISIQSIIHVMTQSSYSNVSLVTDGASEGLYLPELKKALDGSMEDVVVYEDESNSESLNNDSEKSTKKHLSDPNGSKKSSNENSNKNDNDDDDDNTAIRMELHVILSGLFWAISMLATLAPESSKWRYLEYTGLLSVLFGLPPVLRKAINTIRRRQFDANCMMATAAIGACILGEWDEAASVSFLFSVSDYMEVRASSRARRALQAIIQLRPDHASVIDEVTKDITIVPATHVPIHALLSVRTGDKIAADGIVVQGTSSIDQSSLTGESMPVQVTAGSVVSGGSINIGTTQLHIRTTASVQDSAVSRLIRLVEDAQSNRSPTEKLVDTFARAYTPAVVGIAVMLATVPWFWGTEVGRTWTLNALILIVIACPCALTISTPVTYAAGLAATAQRGIVCKGGATLEALGSVKTIIFDKTGTLTEGKFVVTNLQLIGSSLKRNEMLEQLALMEIPSSHPLASTLIQAVKSEGVTIPSDATVKEHTLLPGEGVTALINNRNVFVGNRRLFERLGMYHDLPIENKHIVDQWEIDQGGTVGFIGIEGTGIVGCYCATDVVRSEAKETVQAFLSSGFDVLMLTGDGEGAAKSVARQVGIPESSVHSQLLPEDKLRFVTNLKSTNGIDEGNDSPSMNIFRKEEKVLFCGDGVNDAPALAFADVGISMGEGAALAMEMSDVTLMDSNLAKLRYVVHVGSRVLQTIRENIIISLVCKIIVIGLTFGGYMTLLLAIASDVGVMLLVTLNGMKLLPRSDEAVVSMDDEKSKTNRHRQQRYERVSNDTMDAPHDDVELV